MDGAKEGTGDLSTAWGRGGPHKTPAAVAGYREPRASGGER